MRHLLLLTGLLSTVVPAAAAQTSWSATFEVGKAVFSSAARDSGADPAHIRPWHPTLLPLRLARRGERIGFGLALGYAGGQEAVNFGDFVVLPGTDLGLLEIAPEIDGAVRTPGAGAALRWHLGPILDFWWPSGADPRVRAGAEAGGSLSFPLTERWRFDVRGDLAMTASYLNPDEATDGLRREHTMRRGRLGLGITRQL